MNPVLPADVRVGARCHPARGVRRAAAVVVVTFLAMLIIAPVHAQGIVFPSGSGIINVRDFGAVGDGVADDTAAINAALRAPRPAGSSARTVYLPDGVYRVSEQVSIDDSRTTVQGQSRAGTIIRLADNSPAFQNPAAARHVFTTRTSTSFSANEFRVSIKDLTVDTGVGNPGAMALKYHTNNQGTLRNVTLRSSDPARVGVIGLDLNGSDKGPGMVRALEVDGFDTGVSFGGTEYGMVFEGLTLTNQRVVGIRNIWNLISIRGLTTVGSVPVIQQDLVTQNDFAWAVLTIIDANLTGTGAASGVPALDLRGSAVYLRNIQTSGFAAALRDDRVLVPGASIPGEYVMPRPLALWSAPGGGTATAPPLSLNLPILDTPEVAWDSPTAPPGTPAGWWASATSFGAVPNDNVDDTAAIQAAIDSGATTVFLPAGQYDLAGSVRLRGSLRRFIGMESSFAVREPLLSASTGAFIVESGTSPVVVVERFSDNTLGAAVENFQWFEHSATARTLVVRNAQFGRAYRGSGPGVVFAEDLTFNDWRIGPGQTAYFRQANPENTGTKITNTGGTAWIFGLKTEKVGTAVETFAAGPGPAGPGRTEVLGTLVYPVETLPLQQPMFRAVDSDLSVVIGESSFVFGTDHTVVIEHEIGGVKRRLSDRETGGRVGFFRGATLGLYSGRVPSPLPPAYAPASNRYPFDESSGTTAADTLGTPPRPATLVSNASFAPGRFGNALRLTAPGASVTIPTSSGSPALTSDQGAISLWINSAFAYTDLGMVLYASDTTDANANGGGTQNELHLNFAADGNLNFFIEGGATDLNLSSGSPLNDGRWRHVVVSWSRATPAPDGQGQGYSEMFVDGVRVAWTRTAFNSFPISAVLRLGRPNSASRYFDGLIDDLRLYNRPVQHAEAMDIYFGGLGFTNYAPAVNAGPDNVAQNLASTIAMRGEVADDAQPSPPGNVPLNVNWSVVSGPSLAVAFTNPSSPTTSATFPQPGNYTLRLTASDGDLSVSDDVNVLVVQALTPPWDNDDVGGANAIGYATSADPRTFTVLGSGGGPGGFFDGLHYVYQQLTAFSNVEVQTRLVDLPCGSTGNAGVMYRQQLIGQSAQVALLVTPDRQLVLVNRSGTFGGSGFQVVLPSVTLPIYLRMERINANAARPWYSLDGATWVPVGDIFAATGFVGSYLGLYSANNAGSLCAATFDRTRLGPRCRPDFNSDAVLAPADIFAFLTAFFAGDPRTDFDNNGIRQPADIFAFLTLYFAGC
jgi:hypothetical protein